MSVYFVSGIDTGVGKTVATGLMARFLRSRGIDCITVKMVQTGNVGFSEDLLEHRRLAGTGPLPEDAEGLTAPQIFAFPSSPALSASLEGRTVDLGAIDRAVAECARRRRVVLVEGAGGLAVPLVIHRLHGEGIAGQVGFHRGIADRSWLVRRAGGAVSRAVGRGRVRAGLGGTGREDAAGGKGEQKRERKEQGKRFFQGHNLLTYRFRLRKGAAAPVRSCGSPGFTLRAKRPLWDQLAFTPHSGSVKPTALRRMRRASPEVTVPLRSTSQALNSADDAA